MVLMKAIVESYAHGLLGGASGADGLSGAVKCAGGPSGTRLER